MDKKLAEKTYAMAESAATEYRRRGIIDFNKIGIVVQIRDTREISAPLAVKEVPEWFREAGCNETQVSEMVAKVADLVKDKPPETMPVICIDNDGKTISCCYIAVQKGSDIKEAATSLGQNIANMDCPHITDGRVYMDNGSVAEVKVNQLKAEPKTGRNAPCPCGSGLKFKKCCGGFDWRGVSLN